MNATIYKTLVVALAIALLGALGCSGDDTQEPINTDEPVPTDTGTDDGDPYCEWYEAFPEDDAITTYPYPSGPGGYGFQTSICPSLQPTWGTKGEAIHNICLTDQDGTPRCLDEYYNSPDYDLLFIDFSSTWCSPCMQMAASEWKLIPGMAERGWRIKWITVLLDAGGFQDLTPPTQQDAKNWQELDWSAATPDQYQEGPVLWDAEQVWAPKVFQDWWPNRQLGGYPAWLLVHPSNMVIWDAIVGLPFNPVDSGTFNKWMDDFADDLNELAEQPGACATDPCVILGPPDTDSGTDTN